MYETGQTKHLHGTGPSTEIESANRRLIKESDQRRTNDLDGQFAIFAFPNFGSLKCVLALFKRIPSTLVSYLTTEIKTPEPEVMMAHLCVMSGLRSTRPLLTRSIER